MRGKENQEGQIVFAQKISIIDEQHNRGSAIPVLHQQQGIRLLKDI